MEATSANAYKKQINTKSLKAILFTKKKQNVDSFPFEKEDEEANAYQFLPLSCLIHFCGMSVTSCPFFPLGLTEKLSPERVKIVMEHIWRMQEFCNSVSKLSPDSYEYAYLKAIVLFSPGV